MKPLLVALMFGCTACSAPDTGTQPPPTDAVVPPPAPAVAEAAPRETSPPAAPETPVVVQPVAGTTILAVGQVLEIALEGNASTGYAWEFVSDGAPQLQRVVRAAPVAPANAAAATEGPRMVGSPSTSRWQFRATEPGETEVKLVYRRPWEKDRAPEREAAYKVVVQAAATTP